MPRADRGALGIADDPRVVSRHQQRFHRRRHLVAPDVVLPAEVGDQGAGSLLEPEDIADGTVRYLAQTLGLKQVGCRDVVSARLPNDNEQALFDLTHIHTVIEVQRTSFAEDGTPIRVTVTVYPSDRNQIAYEIGTVP